MSLTTSFRTLLFFTAADRRGGDDEVPSVSERKVLGYTLLFSYKMNEGSCTDQSGLVAAQVELPVRDRGNAEDL